MWKWTDLFRHCFCLKSVYTARLITRLCSENFQQHTQISDLKNSETQIVLLIVCWRTASWGYFIFLPWDVGSSSFVPFRFLVGRFVPCLIVWTICFDMPCFATSKASIFRGIWIIGFRIPSFLLVPISSFLPQEFAESFCKKANCVIIFNIFFFLLHLIQFSCFQCKTFGFSLCCFLLFKSFEL